jgi:plastocyanin
MSRVRSVGTFVAAGILALAVAGCSSGSGTSAAPSAGGAACAVGSGSGVAVSIKDFAFNPSAITAKVGQAIAFTNSDSTDHTATVAGGGCSTGHITPGSTAALTFSAAGTYDFACAIHPSMKGTITVS